MNVGIVATCLALGIVTEVISHSLKLWSYEPAWLRIANVVVVFGLVFGWLSSAVAEQPIIVQFSVGAILGVAYEAANLLFLHLWSFPNNQVLFLRGRTALILGAGIPWGLLPIVAPVIARTL
jgi:hypothetical protein